MTSLILLATLVCVVRSIPLQTYDPEYDNFDAEELVDNLRLLTNYGNCFLDKGPCTTEGSEVKKIIPEALSTKCVKCTPKQRQLVRTVARGFQNQLPELWEDLIKKEDPKGEFIEAFTEFLNAID